MRAIVVMPFLCVPMIAWAQGYRAYLPAWSQSVLMDTLRQDTVVHAPAGAVYSATRAAFKELGIPVAAMDSTAGLVANGKIEATHFFAGAGMSRSFYCGEGAAGAFADAFHLTIAVAAFIKPAPGGDTTLGLAVAASGSDPSGTYRQPKECASTGGLETRLRTLITRRLAK